MKKISTLTILLSLLLFLSACSDKSNNKANGISDTQRVINNQATERYLKRYSNSLANTAEKNQREKNNLQKHSSEINSSEKKYQAVKFSLPNNIHSFKQTSFITEHKERLHNKESVIPPQCYTKHEEKYNPCMTCHQTYKYGSRPNFMSDGELQQVYAFSDVGFTNHWSNLFEDRSKRISEISDQQAIDYIFQDNYTPLIESLESDIKWSGPIPKIENLALGDLAFDDDGFAKDNSGWVAFNYKPLPSTFWPTNGSTDDVMLRLPVAFQKNACLASKNNTIKDGAFSRDTYLANLAVLEMAIKDIQHITLPQVDEKNICQDINGDGKLSQVTQLSRPKNYFGMADNVTVSPMLYPQGVEFLHSIRYVGVNQRGDIFVPPRMKELRYMKKTNFYKAPALASLYGNEMQEKIEGLLPKFVYREEGSSNDFGWTILGFIESKDGHLRLQNNEETAFCMGCHTTIGSTIDQTFSFARKVEGAKGWGYIDLKGMLDAPNVSASKTTAVNTDSSAKAKGEIHHYLEVVGGGDEFRQNQEMIDKWFDEAGQVKHDAVRQADVYELITPSIERALKLNKAYMTIVEDQDYNQGRDANITPASNVYKQVDAQKSPVLPVDKVQQWDIRLNWQTELKK